MGNSTSQEVKAEIKSVPNFQDEGPLKRKVCLLENMNGVSIIVNSTDKSLVLSSGGKISETVLKYGGEEIQEELNEKYPSGIEPGKVAVTNGHGLPFNYVYHCSLQGINNRVSHHEIREIVAECLQEAVNQLEHPTIAFPAIGTGAMNFPPRILKAIYCTILEYIVENPNKLEAAYIIVHPSQSALFDYLEKIDPEKEKKRLTFPVTFPSWSQTENICRVPLPNSDNMYKFAEGKFLETINCDVQIKKIERVENKRLFVAYQRYKNDLVNGESTEKFLWHGTKEEHVDSIIRYGFDWRLTETAAFGKGCYFAVNAEYSDSERYATSNKDGYKFMFLSYVVAGVSCVGDIAYTEANIPDNLQSTVNDEDNPTIYVTYNDDQMYPAFVVVYKHN